MRIGPVVSEGVLLEYGDYPANTGPISIIAVAANGVVTNLLGALPTEQVKRYRVLNGEVWLPSIDPRGAASGFLATNAGGAWQVVTVAVPGLAVVEHMYDVALDPDTGDLLVCGSHSPDTAFVWRSTDGGATWVEELGHATGAADGYNRFYAFRVSEGRLVVSKTNEPGHFVLIGGTWIETADVDLDPEPIDTFAAGLPGGTAKWSSSLSPDGSRWLCDGESVYLLPPD